MLKKIFLLSLITINCYADFDFIEKGQITPYAGYLITPEREKKLRLMNEEFNLYKALEESNKKLTILNESHIVVLTERLKLAQDENQRLADRVIKVEDNSFWKSALFFAAGALLTGVIAVGVVASTGAVR